MTVGIVNLDDVDMKEMAHGERFASRSARLGPLVGAKALGYSIIVLAPGMRACPFHSHRANEEMFLILSGSGTLRYGDSSHAVKMGDVICCPVGGPETAHQLVNDSDGELRYLAVSTKLAPEICEYPDSRKILAYDATWAHVGREGEDVDYWDGES